jgi:hypothetical protein
MLLIRKAVLGNLEEEIVLVPGNSQSVTFTIRFTSKLLKTREFVDRSLFEDLPAFDYDEK